MLFILGMLALDLGVFHRKEHVISVREALIWSAVWITLALLFNGGVYYTMGAEDGMAFLAGYLIEKALSVDHLCVFLVIFSYFRVPPKYQHKVLFWGILSALALRALFIFAGVALVQRFHVTIYIMGAFLLFTAYKMLTSSSDDMGIDPEGNPLLRFLQKNLPLVKHFGDGNFFVREGGQLKVTMLFLVLTMVELTDIVFAVDSIPAILAITTDPFIVFTSNVMAILGLRSLYFALAGLMRAFHYLHYGLAAILGFVGVKMLLTHVFKIPIGVSLGVICGCLALSVVASLVWPQPSTSSANDEASSQCPTSAECPSS